MQNKKLVYDEVRGAREFFKHGIVVTDKAVFVTSVQHAQAYICSVILPETKGLPSLSLPFVRRGKLFQWEILPTANAGGHDRDLHNGLPAETARSLKAATIHAPSSYSHVAALPPNQMKEITVKPEYPTLRGQPVPLVIGTRGTRSRRKTCPRPRR
tara:strand:- start:23 stop:490 length:468 start_codon:yes stop_codon:yes gene_type:complete